MTLLQPSVPEISTEGSFRLVYHGTYGIPVSSPDNPNRIVVDIQEGPLPPRFGAYNSTIYLGNLEPGRSKFVPWDVIRLYWGDPRSVCSPDGKLVFGKVTDSKGRAGDIPPREVEVRRLCGVYGIYEANAPLLPTVVPQVTITNEDDLEIICPAFDPEGQHLYAAPPSGEDSQDIATMIAQMQGRIKQLEAIQVQGKTNDGKDVTDDRPPARKSS